MKRKITIIIEEEEEKWKTPWQLEPILPLDYDPCKECAVKLDPFWNGVCHCTIGSKNRIIC